MADPGATRDAEPAYPAGGPRDRAAGPTRLRDRIQLRLLRPLARRYHRLVARTMDAHDGSTTSLGEVTEAADTLPDDFYRRFQAVLRGSEGSVTAKLEVYRELADDLRERHDAGARWLDLGCGDGRFMELLRAWGWRIEGVDRSPRAVEACTARGLPAVVATVPEYLSESSGETFAAISLIQVIEHLPTSTWLTTIRAAERSLAPGGVLLIETIDPRNPEALQAFFADVTHTWAAHPETLRVMCEFAGFGAVEVRGLNPGADGRPQDFALVARKG